VPGPERKLGRPPSNYPREDFVKYLWKEMRRHELTLGALARGAGIQKWELSRILRNLRACPREVRERLLRFFEAPPQRYDEFRCSLSLPSDPTLAWPDVDLSLIRPWCWEHADDRPFLDPTSCPHPLLHRGLHFLAKGFYFEAEAEFTRAFQVAEDARDYVVQADAATWLAWLYCDTGRTEDSLIWIDRSIALIERHVVGGPILGVHNFSWNMGYDSGLTPDRPAVYVVSRAYYVRFRALLNKVVYRRDWPGREDGLWTANNEFLVIADALEGYAPEIRGHSRRCSAILEAAVDKREIAEVLLSKSEAVFAPESLGAAYVIRDRGVASWLLGRAPKAQDYLEKARHKLSSFADAHGLAVTLHVISETITARFGDDQEARRYALAGAALHPYHFIRDKSAAHLRRVERSMQRRDIEDLMAGIKEPFDMVHKVMARRAEGSGLTGVELINRNLSRLGLMPLNSASQPHGL
jgi:tetratricopeptide (TPR) repeat protein